MENKILRNGPVVCAVDNYYIIMLPLEKNALAEIKIGEKIFYDHSNGIRRSDTPVQKFIVPMDLLDTYKEYTVTVKEVIKRLPYECIKGETQEFKYIFKPLTEKNEYNIYYISDCHGLKDASINAVSFFDNDLDLLLLNGDISSSCSTIDEIMFTYDIAFSATKGERPCIITRGNHDLRGILSEKLVDYMPTLRGKSYYKVKLNNLLFLVLDCGEDKDDTHKEYSETAAYHALREEETDFIENIDEQICHYHHRIILSHIPFYYKDRGICRGEQPFDIEDEIYSKWTSLINQKIYPTLAIAGHLHTTGIFYKDSKYNSRNLNAPIMISGKPINDPEPDIVGAAIVLKNNEIDIKFTDSKHNIIESNVIKISQGANT